MARGDWIKLHRKVMEGPIFQHDGLFRLWCYCLLRANWKATTWLMPGTFSPIEIPRGSFVTGRNSLHKELYSDPDEREMPAPAPTTVWKWLHCLERLGCLKLQNMSNRCTLVSVCNYSTYQDDSTSIVSADAPPRDRRVSAACPLTLTDEELKKEKKERKKQETATPIPFGSPEFAESWAKWQKFRKELKKPLTPTMVEGQLAMLAELGEARAIAMIRHTITKGWQGLREPDQPNSRQVPDDEWQIPKVAEMRK